MSVGVGVSVSVSLVLEMSLVGENGGWRWDCFTKRYWLLLRVSVQAMESNGYKI